MPLWEGRKYATCAVAVCVGEAKHASKAPSIDCTCAFVDLPRTYLAHYELESIIIIIVVIYYYCCACVEAGGGKEH